MVKAPETFKPQVVTHAERLLFPEAHGDATPKLKRMPRKQGGPSGEIVEGTGALLNVTPGSSFTAGQVPWDPAIAVGNQYMLVVGDHSIAFCDKNGNTLPSKHGEATSMYATDFFKPFWEAKRADGSTNPTNINAYLDFPANAPYHVLPNGDLSQPGAISDWYDSRALFDPVSRRFFFLSAARNLLWMNDPNQYPHDKNNLYARRLFAIAVSRTEDPRDGFMMWMTTQSNYADWPRFAVEDGSVIVAHNAPQSGHPLAYVISEADMLADKAQPANFEYYGSDFPGAVKVYPVTVYGPSPVAYFVGVPQPVWDPVQFYAFKRPASYAIKAPLKEATVKLGDPLEWQRDNPSWRNGLMYFCFNEQYVPDRLHVRVVRIPVRPSNSATGAIVASTNPPDYLDTFFGRNGPGDAPTDLVSYLAPSLAVNKQGNCVIAYGRVGVTTSKPLFPEARYSLLYLGQPVPKPSKLIHKGNFMPDNAASLTAPRPVPPLLPTAFTDRLDFVSSCVDPADDETMWVCHAFADQTIGAHGDYRMVVAHVKP